MPDTLTDNISALCYVIHNPGRIRFPFKTYLLLQISCMGERLASVGISFIGR